MAMNRRGFFSLFGAGAALPAVKSIETLKLEENDSLVVKLEGSLSRDQCNAVKERFEKCFPGRKILVLSKGIDLSVVRG